MNQKNTHDITELVKVALDDGEMIKRNTVQDAKRLYRTVLRDYNSQEQREIYVTLMSQNGQHVCTKDFS